MPSQPIPAQESLIDVQFPLQGLDITTEFELQPNLTARVGVNVRGYEAQTQRGRGGSRPGLIRYSGAGQLNGSHLIQDLNIVVRPDDDELLTNDDDTGDGGGAYGDPDGPGEWDPSGNAKFGNTGNEKDRRNPGRRIRPGGSGVQPNKKKPKNGNYDVFTGPLVFFGPNEDNVYQATITIHDVDVDFVPVLPTNSIDSGKQVIITSKGNPVQWYIQIVDEPNT